MNQVIAIYSIPQTSRFLEIYYILYITLVADVKGADVQLR